MTERPVAMSTKRHVRDTRTSELLTDYLTNTLDESGERQLAERVMVDDELLETLRELVPLRASLMDPMFRAQLASLEREPLEEPAVPRWLLPPRLRWDIRPLTMARIAWLTAAAAAGIAMWATFSAYTVGRSAERATA